jgi:hypothetical protein
MLKNKASPNKVAASTFGFAGGMDYHLSPTTVVPKQRGPEHPQMTKRPLLALAVKAPGHHLRCSAEMEHQVAPRQIKMPVKVNSDTEAEETFSQRKRPESGRYLLQVDRQTKGSYRTSEAAQSAALEIKTEYPIVQVSIYDSVDHSHRLVELPGAAS